MRRSPHRLAATLVVASALYASAAFGQSEGTIIGAWTGTYVCRQGLTGVSLTIAEAAPGRARAMFHFYADPSNPGVPTGCTTMDGSYDPKVGTLRLNGRGWLLRPPSYQFVNFIGSVDAAGRHFSGRVEGPGCTSFQLQRGRAPAAPPACTIAVQPRQADIQAAGELARVLAARGVVALNILFETGQASIRPEGRAQLDELGRTLLGPPLDARRISIEGHGDAGLTEKRPDALSAERAEAVRAYLRDNFAIAPARLEAHGFDTSRPRIPEAPEDRRNRRVEVRLLP
jgi:outer membrane protein OmpA-like peptidoglycan-associated protein